MAIYDNDGTALCETGKLYDSDETAMHQIDKVYDNDGTADNLIYRSTFHVIEDGVVNQKDVPDFWKSSTDGSGGSLAYKSGYLTISSSSSGASAGYVCYATSAVPTSEYNTLYITFSASVGHSNGSVFFSVSDITKNQAQGTHSKQTMAIDISGITGDFSLRFYARAWVSSTTTINIYNVWLE